MLDSIVKNIPHKFEMELRHKGIEVPMEAIECIEELVDSARKRARLEAQEEYAAIEAVFAEALIESDD
jgi:hypothetical protein